MVDSEKDLNSVERHILQKMLAWKSVADSVETFRAKRSLAFQMGWNDSGPISETPKLKMIIDQLEADVIERLKDVSHPKK